MVFAMDRPTIDDSHNRAICDEIGERLRALLRASTLEETPELGDKLHELAGGEMKLNARR